MRDTADLVADAQRDRRALSLDGVAFSNLVRRFQDMAFACAFAGTGDDSLAADITQEAFLKAWRNLDQLANPAAFPGWLRQIVRRCAADQRRSSGHIVENPVEIEQIAGPMPGPEETAAGAETKTEVRVALQSLPEPLRETLVLHYMDGHRVADVADFLSISVPAAKKRLERGRTAMKDRLEEKIRESVRAMRPSRGSQLLDGVNLRVSFETAARMGQITLLEAMLVDGIDVNERDVADRTLLHWAVETSHLEAAELLLKAGADQNLRDSSGVSPRHIAQASGNSALLGMLNEYK